MFEKMSNSSLSLEGRLKNLSVSSSSSSASSSRGPNAGGTYVNLEHRAYQQQRRTSPRAPGHHSSSNHGRTRATPPAVPGSYHAVVPPPTARPASGAGARAASAASSSSSSGGGSNRSGGSRPAAPPAAPQQPIIPQSQDVKKFIKEPSYSTILLPNPHLQQQHLQQLHLQQLQQQQQQQLRQHQQQMGNVYVNVNIPEVEEESYASPPSPVSSSYSELRQATKYPPGYHLQQLQLQQQQLQPQQQHSESFYEPIQSPSSTRGAAAGPTSSANWVSPKQSLLQQHGRSWSDGEDYFGTCFMCEDKIVGEGTGCSAMGRLYHIQCFNCSQCMCPLQGKPFYAIEGKPLCQRDYMNTLEKCCKCYTPILDRILRATGKPYHPQCFTCIVCSKSLDGVPFTVDATNQIHCIEDFHRRFAPKCSVCKQPIMPEPGQEETVRVVALDRSFHVHCYKCEDCSLLLSSEEEGHGCYPLDDHVLCKDCSTRRIQDLTFGIGPNA